MKVRLAGKPPRRMRKSVKIPCPSARSGVIVLCLLALGWPLTAKAYGQSLGDIARQEEDRRKALKEPAKVYTNADLKGGGLEGSPPPPQTGTPAQPARAEAPPAAKDKAGEAKAEKDKGPEAKRDQAYWSGRMRDLRERIGRAQTQADGLQSRINALAADFINRSDPAQRPVIERDRLKAVAELARLKKDMEDGKKAIDGLEDDARRAGVPPGWLR